MQLNQKIKQFKEQLLKLGVSKQQVEKIAVFTSPEKHYRMRAEFRIWHDGDDTYYAMHKPDTKEVYTISDFPAASTRVNVAMPKLMQMINANELLRKRLFQVEFLSSLHGELLISLIYHKPLNDEWLAIAKNIEAELNAFVIGRARKQKCVLSQDYVMECLTVHERTFQYQQIENSFTQPNAIVCQKMLEWACTQATTLSHNGSTDLLELYCGNGNFTLPLAQHFNRVFATEVSKTSVRSALFNAELNQVNNLDIARLASEEVVQAMEKVRPFRRLQHIDLDSYQFNTVFVDPPRAGLDASTLQLVQNFDNIIYISCNPNTLIDNLTQLPNHQVTQIAAFDQFPSTHHLEVGVILQKSG